MNEQTNQKFFKKIFDLSTFFQKIRDFFPF